MNPTFGQEEMKMKKLTWVLLPAFAFAGVSGCGPVADEQFKTCQVDADCLQPQVCVDNACVAPGDEDIEIADNVRYLEKHYAFREVTVEADRLVFEFGIPAAELGVAVGDLIVGRGGETGYLRKVEAIHNDGTSMMLETSIAQIQEAVSGSWHRNSGELVGEVTQFESDFGRLRVLRDDHGDLTRYGQLRQAASECDCPGGGSSEDCCEEPPPGDFQYEVKLTEHPANGTIFEKTFDITCGGGGDNLNCTQGQCACENGTCPSGYECVTDACTQDDIDMGREAGVCRRTGVSQASVTVGMKFVEPSAIRFDPRFDVTSKTESHWIIFRKLTHFHVVLGGSFEADMKVQAYTDLGLSYEPDEIEVFNMSKNIWFGIGWFPVMLQLRFTFFAGWDIALNVGGSVTTGVKVSASLDAGGQWHNETTADGGYKGTPTREGEFTTIWLTRFPDPTWYEPEYEAHGKLTINTWVKPQIAAYFYGEGPGPEFWLKPMLTYILHFLPKVCHEMFASMQLGLTLSLGIFEELGLTGPTWFLFSNHPDSMGNALFSIEPWYLFNTCNCEPKQKRVCFNDDKEVRWADDCDVVDETPEGLIEDCDAQGQVCVDGKCVPDGYGDLAGLIKDAQTEEPIEGATIEIYQRDTLLDTLSSGVDGRYSKTDLAVGSYTLEVEKEGYLPATVVVNILDGEVTEVTPLRKLPEDCEGNGTASGQIVNAVTGEGVPAHIEFRAGVDVKEGDVVAEADADADGFYTVELPSGNYTGEVSYNNFATGWFDIVVCGPGDWPNQNAAISPLDDGNWRIVLTWGENPADLDLHCVTPAIEGQQHHIFYRAACRGSRDEAPYADLDVDDRNSFGPETVTIADLRSGDYTFHVHNYGGENEDEPGTLAGSYARVQVYNPDGFRVRAFNVNAGGFWWHAFTLRGPDGDVSQGGSCANAACTNPADFDPPACFPQ